MLLCVLIQRYDLALVLCVENRLLTVGRVGVLIESCPVAQNLSLEHGRSLLLQFPVALGKCRAKLFAAVRIILDVALLSSH